MALTAFQLEVVRLISQNRRSAPGSYVAGGPALNALIEARRYSDDVDIFHDTEEAVRATFEKGRAILQAAGCSVVVRWQWETFIEASIAGGADRARLQWAFDSAFRFFPLVEHPVLGLSLHPFDLATNKVLALVGRAVARDWVDIIACNSRIQRFGFLAWAASGKDPGLSPRFILAQASRSARYTEVELARVQFEGERPTAATLSVAWHEMLDEARAIVEMLPEKNVGECVLTRSGELLSLAPSDLEAAIAAGALRFHAGSLHGAYPQLVLGDQVAGEDR